MKNKFVQTKVKRYFSGGGVEKDGALGGQTLLNGLINPMSLLAGVGLPLLSGLMNQNTPPQVIGASPGRYQAGGPIDPPKRGTPEYSVWLEKQKQIEANKRSGGGYNIENPSLQFLGRQRNTSDPTKWTGALGAYMQGSFTVNDGKTSPLNVPQIKVPATESTPYMYVQDNLYYNPYDKMVVQREKDGSYTPIPTSRTVHADKTYLNSKPGNRKDSSAEGPTKHLKYLTENPNPYAPVVGRLSTDQASVFDQRKKTEMRQVTDPLTNNMYWLDETKHLKEYPVAGGNFKYGGNMQDTNVLNSGTGFQVKGNPEQVDGNYYPQYNAMLDHNEVVMDMEDGTYVFSDSLTPKGGTESYAKMAAKHLKAIKASEKLLERRPSDEASKSTVQKSYAILETIKANQEALAHSKGLRNPDGTPKQSTIQYKNGGRMKCKYGGMIKKYVAGGPLPGLATPDQVFAFQQWYNKNNPTSTIKVDGIAGPTTTNLYKKNMEQFAIDGVGALNPNNKTFAAPDAATDRLMQVDKVMPSTEVKADPMNVIGSNIMDPYTGQPLTFEQEAAAYEANNAPRNPITNTGQGDTIFNSEGTNTASATQRYQTPFTFGDALKVGELVGKFSETLRPAEVEMGNYDSTRITQQSYDPRASIYQADRNFANARNSLDVRNQGQRNATLNSFLANTTNATNNVLNQYQGMNNQALSQYEQSVANQQRYNNQERGRVQTANSMNRAALDSARQNVFTSVGQFGEDLNRKKYAADQVNLMSVLFPEGFGAYMNLLK